VSWKQQTWQDSTVSCRILLFLHRKHVHHIILFTQITS